MIRYISSKVPPGRAVIFWTVTIPNKGKKCIIIAITSLQAIIIIRRFMLILFDTY
jgi:hypothetical protein